jgi:multidrug resistance efflux pump
MRISVVFLSLLIAACGGEPSGSAGPQRDDRNIVRVTGELRSANSHFFAPPVITDQWRFTIAFMAPDGSTVKKGMPVLKFDAQDLSTKLRDKNSNLNEKQKELKKQRIISREQIAEVRLALEEAKALRDKAALKADIPESLLASREFRENQLILQQAGLNLELREKELEKEIAIQDIEEEILEREINILSAETSRLQQSIDSMTILAPGDGVAIHATGRHNTKPSVGDNVHRGRRVMEFPDLEQLEVYLEIPERESARVAVGQEVSFHLDAAPDRQFTGRIVELASVIHSKSINQPARVFDATVSLQNPDPELMRPGMSVSAEIDIADAGGPGS